jgi:hypothetical protein
VVHNVKYQIKLILRNAFITYAHLSKCKLVTFLYFIFALVCVGINHQKGEIEREIVSTFPIIDFGV